MPLLENNFRDFLNKENLRMHKNNIFFTDSKYHICYPHELEPEETLDERYGAITEKYLRRIDNFRKEIKKPTLFIRRIDSAEELSFLYGNEDKIRQIVKAGNIENEIILVIPRYIYELNPTPIHLKYFFADITDGMDFYSIMRRENGLFHGNRDLLNYLTQNYSREKQKDNHIFSLQKELTEAKEALANPLASFQKELETCQMQLHQKDNAIYGAKKSIWIAEQRNRRWMRLLNTDFNTISFPEKVSIYGNGAVGRIFFQKIKDYCSVTQFIDRAPRQAYYENVPVVTVKNADRDNAGTIIVIPSYDYDAIVKTIAEEFGYMPQHVLKLESFLAQGKVLDVNF